MLGARRPPYTLAAFLLKGQKISHTFLFVQDRAVWLKTVQRTSKIVRIPYLEH